MATLKRRIEQALTALIGAIPGPTVKFDAELPSECPVSGFVRIGPLDFGDPVDVILGQPNQNEYEAMVEIDLLAQKGAKTARAATLDDLVLALGAKLKTDPTLGGLVDLMQPSAPQSHSDEAVVGSDAVSGQVVTLTLSFVTSDPLA
ncbi:MAG: hypothetical protein WC722_11480 [Rhodospirillales bacterium]|jgi:hypothetical protein